MGGIQFPPFLNAAIARSQARDEKRRGGEGVSFPILFSRREAKMANAFMLVEQIIAKTREGKIVWEFKGRAPHYIVFETRVGNAMYELGLRTGDVIYGRGPEVTLENPVYPCINSLGYVTCITSSYYLLIISDEGPFKALDSDDMGQVQELAELVRDSNEKTKPKTFPSYEELISNLP
jgi:hypothetical protein